MTRQQIIKFIKKTKKDTNIILAYKCGAVCNAYFGKFYDYKLTGFSDFCIVTVNNISLISEGDKDLDGTGSCFAKEIFNCKGCGHGITHGTVSFSVNINIIDWIGIRNSGRILLNEKL